MAKGQSFIFLGPELGEKLEAVDALRKTLVGRGGSSGQSGQCEETSFYPGETPVPQIVSVIKNGSLFSESRIFIIKNSELVKKADADLLISCLENPGDDTIVLLLSDEIKIDKHLEDAVPKQNKRIFWELFENKKTEWVKAFFRRNGCRVDDGAVLAILEMVENNTDALGRECLRLALFLGKDKVIGAADVESCLSHTREESGFTLFACIARGNLTGSLDIARALLGAKQSTQAISASLAWCFRKLRDYVGLTEHGAANDFELKKIGLGSPKIRADYVEAGRRWKDPGRALALIAEYDYRFRSTASAFEEIIMDEMVLKLSKGDKY
jgi:DNA polymerase-3 subunit delta